MHSLNWKDKRKTCIDFSFNNIVIFGWFLLFLGKLFSFQWLFVIKKKLIYPAFYYISSSLFLNFCCVLFSIPWVCFLCTSLRYFFKSWPFSFIESWSYKSFLFNILLQTSEGSFVKKSAASMLSGKRPAPAAVNFLYLFLLYFLSFILNFAQMDIIIMCYCSFVRLLTKRQHLLNQGLARKEMVLGGQNLQEHLNHLRTLR